MVGEYGRNTQVERYLSIAPVIIAILIGFGIPAAFFTMQYQHDLAAVETMSRIHGSMAIDAINKNPSLWQFEEHKLNAMVENRVAEGEAAEQLDRNQNRFMVVAADGNVLASNTERSLEPPIIYHQTPLFDASELVGHFRVESSVRDLVFETAGVGFISGLVALYIAFSLRTLPLRALRGSYSKLLHIAHHDTLTGLPNRKALQYKLETAIRKTDPTKQTVLLLFIDLDNFKDVNDSLGHAAGDTLLQILGDRMLSVIRASDTLARLGGDEFIILLPAYEGSESSLESLIENIRSVMAMPVALSGQTIKTTGSIGVSRYPQDGRTADELLKRADMAMYDAKKSGRDAFSFYRDQLSDDINDRLQLTSGIAKAIENGEFYLVYQPKVDQKTKLCVGVEALLRWNHGELGMVSPDKFIPHAEESGAIIPIGDWVLNEACQQNRRWQNEGHKPITMAVNVSAKQFASASFVESVEKALAQSGLAPEYLELEITESLIMADVDLAFETMKRITAIGVKLAIDDFGTGYSSLAHLKKFPVSTLKIDKSFIDGIKTDGDDETIIRIIIDLAHQLKMQVVAEGVETPAQSTFLDQNHCDLSQGYYFSKPVLPGQVFPAQQQTCP